MVSVLQLSQARSNLGELTLEEQVGSVMQAARALEAALKLATLRGSLCACRAHSSGRVCTPQFVQQWSSFCG